MFDDPQPPEPPETAHLEAEAIAKEIVTSVLEDYGLHASLGSADPYEPSLHTRRLLNDLLAETVMAVGDMDDLLAVAAAMAKVSTVMGVMAQIAASIILDAEAQGFPGPREQLQNP